MQSTSKHLDSPDYQRFSFSRMLALAGSAGMVIGFVEALGRLSIQHFGVAQFLWAAPLGYLFLFLPLGMAAWACGRLSHQIPISWIVFIFAWIGLYDWGSMLTNFPRWRYLVFVGSCLLARAIAPRICRSSWFGAASRWKSISWAVVVLLLYAVVFGSYSAIRERRQIEALKPNEHGKNVLFIVIDTLRADHLPTYGYPQPTAPYLAQLANQGIVFENAIAPSSWTRPSHASMLSGLYPHEHGTESGDSRLSNSVPVIPEEFLRLGYRTAVFSSNTDNFTREFGFGRGVVHFEDLYPSLFRLLNSTHLVKSLGRWMYRHNLASNVPGRRPAEEITQAALRWTRSKSTPFFVMLNYSDIHSPYVPPQPYRSKFVRPGAKTGRIWAGFGQISLTQPQRQDEIDAYDASIAYVDAQIQELLQGLRSAGLLKNTIVVITSDHGEQFDEHGLYLHGNGLYRQLLWVPLVIWEEHSLPQGLQISQPVSLVHLPSTFLRLATGGTAAEFQQRSLSELWSGELSGAAWPSPIAELAALQWNPKYPNYRQGFKSIVTSEWHYIRGDKSGEELYRCADGIERDNLATQPAFRPVCDRLKAQLEVARSGAYGK